MRVSIIIPTRNGAQQLRELLAALQLQTLAPDEIIVIDSSSTDGTVAVARQYGAHVKVIEQSRFDHGSTRTMGARMAAGDILVYLTQDVLPRNRRLLEHLVAPLTASPAISVAYGRQLPSFEANEIAAHLRLFNYPGCSAIRSFADRNTQGLQTVFASNSCAAYRKSALSEIGYFAGGLIFGEDSCAAGRLLEAGSELAYVAEAEVYHSHNYSWAEDFGRYFDIGVFHQEQKWLIETFGGADRRGLAYLRSGITYLCNRRKYSMLGDFMVRVGVKFIGYRLGRLYKIIPRPLASRLSMNSNWWYKDAERLNQQ
jgi:rhamnosyltransferase